MKERDNTRGAAFPALADALRQDARYALRGLRAKPGFTVAVVEGERVRERHEVLCRSRFSRNTTALASRPRSLSSLMPVTIRVMKPGDEPQLANVADDVFDGVMEPARLRGFLEMPGHFLIVAIDNDVVVGMTTAVRYLNPDKPPELWINEVGVAPPHRNRGVATALLAQALQIGRDLDCKQAWVLTDDTNEPAKRVYSRVAESFRQSRQLLFELHLTSDR